MSRGWSILVAGVVACLLAGCMQVPDSGPVQTVDTPTGAPGDQRQRFQPRGPQPGESSPELVRHFFEAMTASPMSATVARQFLTKRAAANWSPEGGFLTYAGKVSPEGDREVTVNLTGVSRFDARGSWLGPTDGGQRLDLEVEIENGQRRIATVPDLLMVSETWFETQTLPLSLYFFDPDTRTLVPEPVFVPRGEQMPTLLVQGLLEGPVDDRVEQSFVPAETTLNGPVTVRPDGVAEIPLAGDLASTPAETVELMAAQFAWTLSQVPSVLAVRMTLEDGESLALPDGDNEYDVQRAAGFDPAGVQALDEFYGLQDGLAVRVLDGEAQTLVGPFGQADRGLRDVSVNLDASRIAGVTLDGSRVLLSGVNDPEDTRPEVALSGGSDLLQTAWDAADRLWAVDLVGGEAVVWVITDNGVQVVDVPGVTGQPVVDFSVSRDGTRLVAAIRGRDSDRIVLSRLFPIGADSVVKSSEARTIVSGDGERLQIRDLGWRSPTALYYINALGGRQTNLRSALIDGSPTLFDPEAYSGVFPDLGTRVISSPRPQEPVYLQQAGGGYQPVLDGAPLIPDGVRALTYVG